MPDFSGRGYRQYYEERHHKPPAPRATYWLLGIITGVFFLQLFTAAASQALHDYLFVISTDWMARPWSPFTSTFSHGGFAHLFLNGLFLYFFGPTIENLVKWKRYIALFVLVGAIAGIAQVHLESYVDPTGDSSALGASGALMGLFGIILVLMPKAKIFVFAMFIPVQLPIWLAGLLYVLADLAGAFNPADRVGNFAHLSGLAIGAAYGFYVKLQLKRHGLRLVPS